MLREIHVLTIFPGIFDGFLRESLLGKAIANGRLAVTLLNFRDFAQDRHHSVDDVPYGGGSGMVLAPGPVVAAIEALPPGTRTILLTPQGKRFEQADAARLATHDRIALVCGRYEGFDERIRAFVDEELSVGDYVLAGGEAAAMVIVEAVTRLLPGVMGNEASASDESFSAGTLEYPQYTRPRSFRGMEVPEVLVSGHHAEIDRWRREQALRRTAERRPDLIGAGVSRGGRGENDDRKEDRRVTASSTMPGGCSALSASPPPGPPRKLAAKPLASLTAGGTRAAARVDVVLLHYPVRSRTGDIVTTAVTNLDIHDIARASRTYGVRAYHVVTPLAAQRALVSEILTHWRDGKCGLRVPERASALSLVRVHASLDDALLAVQSEEGARPQVVVTAANARGRPTATFAEMRRRLVVEPRPVALCFGTGWGLADEVLDQADAVLEPVMQDAAYNHLSVRVAVGVVLDRLLGDRGP